MLEGTSDRSLSLLITLAGHLLVRVVSPIARMSELRRLYFLFLTGIFNHDIFDKTSVFDVLVKLRRSLPHHLHLALIPVAFREQIGCFLQLQVVLSFFKLSLAIYIRGV